MTGASGASGRGSSSASARAPAPRSTSPAADPRSGPTVNLPGRRRTPPRRRPPRRAAIPIGATTPDAQTLATIDRIRPEQGGSTCSSTTSGADTSTCTRFQSSSTSGARLDAASRALGRDVRRGPPCALRDERARRAADDRARLRPRREISFFAAETPRTTSSTASRSARAGNGGAMAESCASTASPRSRSTRARPHRGRCCRPGGDTSTSPTPSRRSSSGGPSRRSRATATSWGGQGGPARRGRARRGVRLPGHERQAAPLAAPTYG